MCDVPVSEVKGDKTAKYPPGPRLQLDYAGNANIILVKIF